jgi:hypothetical protein
VREKEREIARLVISVLAALWGFLLVNDRQALENSATNALRANNQLHTYQGFMAE